ncbi:MAG: hypothetical protein FWD21_01500, partial [Peptococcaceae bacterium]|nr:hypothetical protein [Peptococcaceae bacterium]
TVGALFPHPANDSTKTTHKMAIKYFLTFISSLLSSKNLSMFEKSTNSIAVKFLRQVKLLKKRVLVKL